MRARAPEEALCAAGGFRGLGFADWVSPTGFRRLVFANEFQRTGTAGSKSSTARLPTA